MNMKHLALVWGFLYGLVFNQIAYTLTNDIPITAVMDTIMIVGIYMQFRFHSYFEHHRFKSEKNIRKKIQ